MVNTELTGRGLVTLKYYNILNIVVNTEQAKSASFFVAYYNILNIVVNTEQTFLMFL